MIQNFGACLVSLLPAAMILSRRLLMYTYKTTHGSNSMFQACKVGSKLVCMKEVSLLRDGPDFFQKRCLTCRCRFELVSGTAAIGLLSQSTADPYEHSR